MVESLRRTDEFREADFLVSTTDFPADGEWYPFPVGASFHSIKNEFSRWPRLNCLYFLLILLPASVLWAVGKQLAGCDLPVGRRLRALLRAYADAELVVAAGGCYLYTTSAARGNVILLINTYSFFFGVLLGKPVYLYAQSIGPFTSSMQAWLVRWALSKVRLVEFREHISGRLLDEWRLPTPTRAAADGAFLVPARPPTYDLDIRGHGQKNTVGMTVRKWYRDLREQESYERTMAAFVEWLSKEREVKVVLLPQVTFAQGNDDDRVAARDVMALLDRQDQVRVVADELSTGEIKWLCGQMDFFVGTRMHSNIFALSLGVPTLAISYQHKTEGIMATLGLGDFVVPISAISLDFLKERFDDLVHRRREVCSRLSEVIPEIELQAELAGRYIAEDFSGAAGRGGSRNRPASMTPRPLEPS
jgi:colanic acid/amylovoran biosynthesis protein